MDHKIMYYVNEVEKLIAGESVMPVTCEIDPSNRCQLSCNFCMFESLRHEPEDLSFNIYRHLLIDLKKIGTKSITFTGGGEPTMNPNFAEMVDLAETFKFEYGLITNGLRLSRIERPDRFKFIRVSLDAATSKTYQRLKKATCFDRVIGNITHAIRRGALVGISYVVNEINRDEIEKAQKLAKELRVAYIQFKPAWHNGEPYSDYEINGTKETIDMERYRATDMVPCKIAGLIGIVGADAKVYYCCQYRGNERYCLGDLNETPFPKIWARRPGLVPDIGRCPNCRYMNYTRAYKMFTEKGTLFVEHKAFL